MAGFAASLHGNTQPVATSSGGFAASLRSSLPPTVDNPVPLTNIPAPQVSRSREDIINNSPVGQDLKQFGEFIKGTVKQVVDFLPQLPSYLKVAATPTQIVPKLAGAATSVLGSGASLAGLIQRGIASVTNTQVPERWDISKQAHSLDKLVNNRVAEDHGIDGQKGYEIGRFLGSFLSGAVAAEAAALTVGSKVLLPIANKFLPGAANFIPSINNAIGFLGIGQIEHNPENGTRVDRLKNDLIMLALFETGGLAVKNLSKGTSKLISNVVGEVKGKPKIDLEVIQPKVETVKQAIKTETGKTPELIVAEEMATGKAPKLEIAKEVEPLVKKSAKTTQSKAQPITREARKQAQEKVSNLIQKADTPEKVTKTVNVLADIYKSDPAKLRVVRAQLQKEMMNMSGASSGYYKTDFKHLQQAKTTADLGPMLNKIQDGIDRMDQLIKNPEPVAVKPTVEPRIIKPGEKTPSKIALSIERKSVESGLTKKLENIAGYDKITIERQARLATDLITKDLEKARRVIRGEEPLPKDLRGTALITAAEEYIKKTGDVQMVKELANSPLVSGTSAAAQELRLAAEREPDSLALKLRQLKEAKDEAFQRRYKGKTIDQATAETVKDINKSIRKTTPSRSDWNSFIKSIQC